MTNYGKFRLAIGIALILLTSCITIALFQFHALEQHLVSQDPDFSIAMQMIQDAKKWLFILASIAVFFIFTIITILINTYIKPHRDRHRMNNKITRALSNNEFELVFQAQLDLHTHHIISAESLLRWSHPEKGMISPDKFIQLAEQTNSIMPLGGWILDTACAQYKTWRDKEIILKKLAVNVSASQLKSDLLIQQIKKALTTYQIPASSLEIEVTESAIMTDMKTCIHYLQKIHDLGVLIALDDFGTGHSSLQYIKKLPIDFVKIDKTFVTHCHEDKTDYAILKMMIELAHTLNLKVIAEGVENQDQLRILEQLECDLIQGYLISKPLAVASFEALHMRFNSSI